MTETLETKLNMSLDDLVQKNQESGKRHKVAFGAFPKDRLSKRATAMPYTRGSKHGATSRVYVGNLSWQTSWQTLKDHFKSCGNVVFADVFVEEDGKSKGCGIVEFETWKEALKAIRELNDSYLDERMIFVREDKFAEELDHSFSKRIEKKRHVPGEGQHQIFIKNLPYTTSWQDLKDHYRQFGNVIRAEVPQNPDGSSKGIGTVSFENSFEALKAIRGTNNTEFEGRILEVRMDKFAL